MIFTFLVARELVEVHEPTLEDALSRIVREHPGKAVALISVRRIDPMPIHPSITLRDM